MTITCQHHGCDAMADTKVRETDLDTGQIIWWRYLCVVHLEEEYGPWLNIKRR
jgi:hypothetical protein